MKINGIFEARRGKRRMKRVSQSAESSSGRGLCMGGALSINTLGPQQGAHGPRGRFQLANISA